ncbi:hypothetical protein ES724_16030 [Gillisia hiemivivida]|uniref:TonB C-terminal domain-containing protein n=2 Tax=Gillisia hiemivivida TaxID=291190 RepID=A0A5C6ZSR8_9FLAO|nr:hypothetical protein ES724_16030 [Gillisia hiemivivida]
MDDQDAALKANLWDEITAMDKNGVGFSEISEFFLIEKGEHIKSKEAYYRMYAFMKLIHQKTVEREKAAGTYDENSKNPFQSILNQDYEEYVEMRKNKPRVEKRSAEQGDEQGVPFSIIDEVPTYPGCENSGSNDEKKKCMSEKIQEYVNEAFNTDLGKELNLKGVNRIIVQFKIDKSGNIIEARARAPHPALEAEAIRVINEIPQMVPGKQNGQASNVMYSLPIVFQVGE